MHVWPEQGDAGTFWCRRCDQGGDRIKFLMFYRGLSFREAALACGREVKSRPHRVKPYTAGAPGRGSLAANFKPVVHPEAPALWQEKCGVFVERCRAQLGHQPQIMAWLKDRGISAATATRAWLGWNPGQDGKDIYRGRAAWGMSAVLNPKTGRPKKLWLPVGLTIPCFNANGRLERIRIRRFQDDNLPRYYVVPGGSSAIMTINPERKAQVVVEAELDAILLAAVTSAGAVALGSCAVKPDQAAHTVLTRALQILLALDADEAGKKAAGWWLANYPRCDRWPVPIGKDPGEAFAEGCDLNEWVNAGLPPALKIRTALASQDLNPETDKSNPASLLSSSASAQGPLPGVTVAAETTVTPEREVIPKAGPIPGPELRRQDRLDLFISALRLPEKTAQTQTGALK